jgi:hypothetical protein
MFDSARFVALVGLLIGLLTTGGPATAITVTFGGPGDPSLHGATGALDIVGSGSSYTVTWSMDFTGFDDAGAIATGHPYLTDVAFKAFSSISAVSLVDSTLGTLHYPSNVNNASDGCDIDDSPASFVCVVLDPIVDATTDGSFAAVFNVEGTLATGEYSYRGKFGEADGWVISESGPPIPEPSAALVFTIGSCLVGARCRRR